MEDFRSDSLPIHTEVWAKLDAQNKEMHQLKRANSRLKSEVRALRKERAKLIEEQMERHHYRNGRKRGRYGRNG